MTSNAIPIRAIPNPTLSMELLIQGFLGVMLVVTGIFVIRQVSQVSVAQAETLPEVVVYANGIETLPEIVVYAHRR